jgi:hypothetical protein
MPEPADDMALDPEDYVPRPAKDRHEAAPPSDSAWSVLNEQAGSPWKRGQQMTPTRIIPVDPGDDQLRRKALGVQETHDPAKQGHGHRRCEHCHYTSHPCDAYDMATTVLELLDRGRTDA